MKTKQTPIWKKLFSGSGWSLFTLFVWELIEEGLENLIALAISSVFALFLVKALSTLAIVSATQGTKLLIKKLVLLLVPIVKKFTYKEGKDKVKALKNYWTKVWGNKITGTSVGLGFAGISYFQTLMPFAHHCWWIALIVFAVFYNLGIFFGGETLNQIQERLASSVLRKEEKEIIKEAKKRLAQLEKSTTQSEAERQKAEADRRAKELRDAKVNQAMNQLRAEQVKK